MVLEKKGLPFHASIIETIASQMKWTGSNFL